MPVFKLSDLTNLWIKGLDNVAESTLQDWKEGRLLVAVPDLTAHIHTNEKDVL